MYPDTLTHLNFPEDFAFGVATAAYQIEGAVNVGGRGPSNWDAFCRTDGAIVDGSNADVASGHYDRLEEDLDLVAELGVDHYRFSIAWPRIQPLGTGAPNPEGIAFYDRVISGLLARNIEPIVTLFHWDLPQNLEDAGGWANRATAHAFNEYVRIVVSEFRDRVGTWITLNEPWCVAFEGYGHGMFAPGRRSGADALRAAHHLNLAHGLATSTIRSLDPAAQVSIVLNFQTLYGSGPGGEEAVRRIDAVANRVFTGPLLNGSYPDDLTRDTASVSDWSWVHEGDLKVICQRLDWLGINYYSTATVTMPETGPADDASLASPFPGSEKVEFLRPAGPFTDYDWNVYPKGLLDLLERVSAQFPSMPIVVTENGASYTDIVEAGPSGTRVRDFNRIDYISLHLTAVHAALERGVNVIGYYVWTLLDDFEWNQGYEMKFGLVHVDFDSLERTPKESFQWYRRFLEQRSTTRARAGAHSTVGATS